MNKNELARRLMATFLEELQEHVETLNRGLLKLEKNPHVEGRVTAHPNDPAPGTTFTITLPRSPTD